MLKCLMKKIVGFHVYNASEKISGFICFALEYCDFAMRTLPL